MTKFKVGDLVIDLLDINGSWGVGIIINVSMQIFTVIWSVNRKKENYYCWDIPSWISKVTNDRV